MGHKRMQISYVGVFQAGKTQVQSRFKHGLYVINGGRPEKDLNFDDKNKNEDFDQNVHNSEEVIR